MPGFLAAFIQRVNAIIIILIRTTAAIRNGPLIYFLMNIQCGTFPKKCNNRQSQRPITALRCLRKWILVEAIVKV